MQCTIGNCCDEIYTIAKIANRYNMFLHFFFKFDKIKKHIHEKSLI